MPSLDFQQRLVYILDGNVMMVILAVTVALELFTADLH